MVYFLYSLLSVFIHASSWNLIRLIIPSVKTVMRFIALTIETRLHSLVLTIKKILVKKLEILLALFLRITYVILLKVIIVIGVK